MRSEDQSGLPQTRKHLTAKFNGQKSFRNYEKLTYTFKTDSPSRIFRKYYGQDWFQSLFVRYNTYYVYYYDS